MELTRRVSLPAGGGGASADVSPSASTATFASQGCAVCIEIGQRVFADIGGGLAPRSRNKLPALFTCSPPAPASPQIIESFITEGCLPAAGELANVERCSKSITPMKSHVNKSPVTAAASRRRRRRRKAHAAMDVKIVANPVLVKVTIGPSPRAVFNYGGRRRIPSAYTPLPPPDSAVSYDGSKTIRVHPTRNLVAIADPSAARYPRERYFYYVHGPAAPPPGTTRLYLQNRTDYRAEIVLNRYCAFSLRLYIRSQDFIFLLLKKIDCKIEARGARLCTITTFLEFYQGAGGARAGGGGKVRRHCRDL
ncbi:hypothetical protein EVAR_76622_1 [Eumeta japonica]|uniref:Uncharacterized protein n=1 Tax=Eumeta variegata TaxID=151549 RepID=A0A4C1T880_EUMVA|nr:hypothetical protein EVAR_76622_1 [Eumeta japonica]